MLLQLAVLISGALFLSGAAGARPPVDGQSPGGKPSHPTDFVDEATGVAVNFMGSSPAVRFVGGSRGEAA